MGGLPDELQALLSNSDGVGDLRGQAFAPGAEVPEPIQVSDEAPGSQDENPDTDESS